MPGSAETKQQISDVNDQVGVVSTSVDTLSAPGAKLFFKGLGLLGKASSLLNDDDPNSLAQINAHLGRIEAKIDNTFNMTLSALEYNDLQNGLTAIVVKATQITELLSLPSISASEYKKLNDHLDDLNGLVIGQVGPARQAGNADQVGNGPVALRGFRQGKQTAHGRLASYVGQFLKIVRLVYQSVAHAQYAFNSVLQRNLGLGDGMNAHDAEMGRIVRLYSVDRLKDFDAFIANVHKHYPEWCRGVFTGETQRIHNRKWPKVEMCFIAPKGDSTTWVEASDNYVPKGYVLSGALTTIDIKYEEDELKSAPAVWTIHGVIGPQAAASKTPWFCDSSKDGRIYVWRNAQHDPRYYDFSIWYESETIIIDWPNLPGKCLGYDSQTLWITKKPSPEAPNPLTQWTMAYS